MALLINRLKDESLVLMHPDEIDGVWSVMQDYVVAALDRDHGELSVDDIYHYLRAGEAQMWALYDDSGLVKCGLVTQLQEYEQLRVCRVLVLAGRDADWERYSVDVESWARDEGCQRVESICRPGFARVMKKHGYQQLYVVIAKDLETRH